MFSNTRLSTNEIIDNIKVKLNIRFDSDLEKLMGIKKCVCVSRFRESPTILFPIMDLCVKNNISIEEIVYGKN